MFLKLICDKCCSLTLCSIIVSLRLEVLDVAAREVVPTTQRPGVDSLLLEHKLCQEPRLNGAADVEVVGKKDVNAAAVVVVAAAVVVVAAVNVEDQLGGVVQWYAGRHPGRLVVGAVHSPAFLDLVAGEHLSPGLKMVCVFLPGTVASPWTTQHDNL